jgi:hypothetical protein
MVHEITGRRGGGQSMAAMNPDTWTLHKVYKNEIFKHGLVQKSHFQYSCLRGVSVNKVDFIKCSKTAIVRLWLMLYDIFTWALLRQNLFLRYSDKKATVITPTSISPNPQIVEYDYIQFGCINKININCHINYAFFVPPLAYINSHYINRHTLHQYANAHYINSQICQSPLILHWYASIYINNNIYSYGRFIY